MEFTVFVNIQQFCHTCYLEAVMEVNIKFNKNNTLINQKKKKKEIKLWNLRTKTTIHTYKDAHSGFVRGIAVEPSGKRFFSCGDDKTVKLWDIPSDDKDQDFSLISEVKFNSIFSQRKIIKTKTAS